MTHHNSVLTGSASHPGDEVGINGLRAGGKAGHEYDSHKEIA